MMAIEMAVAEEAVDMAEATTTMATTTLAPDQIGGRIKQAHIRNSSENFHKFFFSLLISSKPERSPTRSKITSLQRTFGLVSKLIMN